ncbi:MAG: type II toxin-antitoxin system death-on-curing family toxin [Wenzhouxiangellaceae bacterium]
MTVLDPVWLPVHVIEAIHERQIAEHGGDSGIRDHGLLESAVARPRHQLSYGGDRIDIPSLAAAYGFGLARNHPFVDGNKRTAYVVMRGFLILNGWELIAPMTERYPAMMALASGQLAEQDLAEWLRRNSRPEQVSEAREQYV